MDRVMIGTSGWSYKSWEKRFYPARLPLKHHFEFYTTQFSTVEINATFYRLPLPHTVTSWRDRAPRGFTFAIKGSRFITLMKKLSNLNRALETFFDRIAPTMSGWSDSCTSFREAIVMLWNFGTRPGKKGIFFGFCRDIAWH